MVFFETPVKRCPLESKGKVVLSEKTLFSASASGLFVRVVAIRAASSSGVFKAYPFGSIFGLIGAVVLGQEATVPRRVKFHH